MHAILTSFGSTGDLIPILAIGRELAGRGHRVSMAAGEGFRERVEEAGLNFVPVCTAEEYERSLREVGVLASRYRGIFFRKHVVGWNAALLRFLAEEGREDAVYVSAERPTLWADLCAHAHFRMPCVRLAVDLPAPGQAGPGQAAAVGSELQRMLSEEWQHDWRGAARSAGVNAGHRHTERLSRATLGSVPRIALWPEWFAPAAARNLPRFGFVGAAAGEGPRSATAATAEGANPRPRIVFSAGSLGTTAPWERQFAEVSRQLCRELGCDGLMLGGQPDGGGPVRDAAGGTFEWKRYVPLENALSGASAIVHHGGIGTIAAAMKAIVPQLMVPRMFGQSSNASCARRLGVGSVMAPEAYSVANAKAALKALIGDPAFRTRAAACAAQIDLDRDRRRVADFVEHWQAKAVAARTSTAPVPVAA